MGEITEAHLKRTPIVLSSHTVALVTLFHLPHDNLEDLWVTEYLDHIKEIDFAAAQLIAQITEGGHCTPAFMIALKREVTKWLQAEDDDRAAGGVETHFATAP